MLALERLGVRVDRFALRGWDAQLVDPEDLAEQSETHYLLKGSVMTFVWACLACAVGSPVKFSRSLWAAIKLSRKAERSLFYHLIYLAEACKLLEELRRCGAQHLHVHFGTNAATVAMLMRALGGPTYSITVHGPEEFDKPLAISLREKISHSKFVVAVSSFGRSQLFRWVEHEEWNKIHVVHCGVEPAFHSGDSVPVPNKPRLVCVGRLCEQKGQLLLVEAAARLHHQGFDFELVLAGDGEMRSTIELLINQYGLNKKVIITGWISSAQVREEILSSRAMVLASFAEGLPVVLMEALSLRRPVISTYIAGIPELVVHGENGWLCAAGSVTELAQAIAECLAADTNQLDAMGHAGFERILLQHSIDSEAARLYALLNATA